MKHASSAPSGIFAYATFGSDLSVGFGKSWLHQGRFCRAAKGIQGRLKGGWSSGGGVAVVSVSYKTHRIHVWYIYLDLVNFYGKCR